MLISFGLAVASALGNTGLDLLVSSAIEKMIAEHCRQCETLSDI